jgi:hypothetical protein
MREPISNFFDRDRVEKMLIEYLSNRKNFNIELLDKLPHNVVLVWLEIIVV